MALVGFGSTDSTRGGCGCNSMRGFGTSPDGLGTSPDGLGAVSNPLIGGTVTGNSFFDAVLGTAVGYSMSPKPSSDVMYAAAGGAVVGLIGLPGLLGLVAVNIVRKASSRSSQ